MCFFFNPGPVWRVPIPNRYTAKAKLCFCKNNKRRIITPTQPTAAATTQPKPRSNFHYGTEISILTWAAAPTALQKHCPHGRLHQFVPGTRRCNCLDCHEFSSTPLSFRQHPRMPMQLSFRPHPRMQLQLHTLCALSTTLQADAGLSANKLT